MAKKEAAADGGQNVIAPEGAPQNPPAATEPAATEPAATRQALVLRDEGDFRVGTVVTLTEVEIAAGEADGWLDGHPAAVAAASAA